MIAYLTLIYWAALAAGALALLAALLDRIGLSAVLISASLATTAALSAAEGLYVWTLLLAAVTLAVPPVYVRVMRRRRLDGAR